MRFKQSWLSQVCFSKFARLASQNKPRQENGGKCPTLHIVQKNLQYAPLFVFRLSHTPKRTQGLDRKYTVKKKVHQKAATDMQRAVSQDGGITVV